MSDTGLMLGVTDRKVSYVSDKTGKSVAFVQQGDLWEYQIESNKIERIFSFRRGISESDFRDSRSDHNIKILRVSKSGNVDFILYGYMNRGVHEGCMGISVCHYNSDQNMVTEKAFIPSTESYDFLEQGLDKLCYMNKNNQLFMLSGGNLYQVDLAECSYEILQESIQEDCFAASETGACAAWAEEMSLYDSKTVVEMDFDEQKSRTIKAEKGQRIRVLGFMNEDVIYGIVLDGDSLTDENGHTTDGITLIRIEGFDGTVKKEYHQDGYYITDVTVGSTLMQFNLSEKTGSSYTVKNKDNIMNNQAAAAKVVSAEQSSTTRQGVIVKLAFDNKPETDEPLILTAKMKNTGEKTVQLDVDKSQISNIYYVYAKGGLDSTWTDPAQAILHADSLTGVVLNRAQQYVWERGNMKTQLTLNTEDVPEIIRSGSWDKDVLQQGLGDSGTVIDLTGCSLESVLYEISAQRAVIAKTGADSSVVIVGYDQYNTWLLDPATGEVSPYGMNDSTALFQAAGNVFISYLDNQK